MLESKHNIIRKLQASILDWQGIPSAPVGSISIVGLQVIESVFPNNVFPVGALHEFICAEPEHIASCGGFVAGLLSALMTNGSLCLWIGINKQIFPPSLTLFGINPDRILFVDANNDTEALWAAEEGLKCKGIAAVVAELNFITISQSRRLQLAAEQNNTACLMLRKAENGSQASMCAARWQITPIPSRQLKGMPGVGFPRWNVELLKVRNGNPGKWLVEWSSERFKLVSEREQMVTQVSRKVG